MMKNLNAISVVIAIMMKLFVSIDVVLNMRGLDMKELNMRGKINGKILYYNQSKVS